MANPLRAAARRTRDMLREEAVRARLRLALATGSQRRAATLPVTVSLTTIPERLTNIADVAIASILLQRPAPERVILWLPEELEGRRHPVRFAPLVSAGLEVRYCRDLGPHKKLLFTLQEDPEAVVVTADDDVLYPQGWLSELYRSYLADPDAIHAFRAHLMTAGPDGRLADYHAWRLGAPGVAGPSHLLFPTGVSGVLYPPRSLAPEVFDVDAFRRLCPFADDIWWKAMALLKGTPARKVRRESTEYPAVRGSQTSSLYATNRAQNDPQLRATFEAYGLDRMVDELLLSEAARAR